MTAYWLDVINTGNDSALRGQTPKRATPQSLEPCVILLGVNRLDYPIRGVA